MRILIVSCCIFAICVMMSCRSQKQSKDLIFIEDISYENADIGEPLDSISLQLVIVKDSILGDYINRYINDNFECMGDTFRAGVAVYSVRASDIVIGRSESIDWISHFEGRMATIMNGVIVTVNMNPKILQRFFTLTQDSIVVRNLYSKEQKKKSNLISGTDDGFSQWEFVLENSRLTPKTIYIESMCAKTTPENFPPKTKIIRINH